MNLILFGFQGAGKTHFGTLLAQKFSLPFLDTDALLSHLDGRQKTPRQLYIELGEKGFRALEKQAIHALQHQTRSLIALGGGALLDPENIALLKQIGTFVYLKMGLETVEKKFLAQKLPPFIDPHHPKASIRAMFEERKPIYESIPAQEIDVDTLDPSAVLIRLTQILTELFYGL